MRVRHERATPSGMPPALRRVELPKGAQRSDGDRFHWHGRIHRWYSWLVARLPHQTEGYAPKVCLPGAL